MKYLNKRFSVTMPRDTRGCCGACVFGEEQHATWCKHEEKTVKARGQRADDAGVEVLRPAVGTAAEPAVSGEGKDKSCMSAVRGNVAPAGEEWKITGNAAQDERID